MKRRQRRDVKEDGDGNGDDSGAKQGIGDTGNETALERDDDVDDGRNGNGQKDLERENVAEEASNGNHSVKKRRRGEHEIEQNNEGGWN